MTGQSYSRWLFWVAECKLKPVQSIQVSTWPLHLLPFFSINSNFGCYWFRIRYFAYCHLKLLCCFIGIWADVLFSERSSTEFCCLAQDSIWYMLICFFALFLLRDQWMIKNLSRAMSTAFAWKKISQTSLKISFHMKKNQLVANNCKELKVKFQTVFSPYWLSNKVNIVRVVALFLKPACRSQQGLGTPCICARLSNQPYLRWSVVHWFCSQSIW